MVGNPPWDTLSPDTREFFGTLVPGIRRLSKAEKDAQISVLLEDEHYQTAWHRHQRALFATAHFLKTSGRYVMYAEGNLGKGDFNIYRSFAELALTFTTTGGFAGQILQSGIYAGANASAIRKHLLDECTWTAVYGFNNKGGTWFPGVALENFAAYAARVGLPAEPAHEIRAAFGMTVRRHSLRTSTSARSPSPWRRSVCRTQTLSPSPTSETLRPPASRGSSTEAGRPSASASPGRRCGTTAARST